MTLADLEHDAIRLEAMIQALDVVHERASVASDGADLPPDVRDACNAMPVLIESVRQRAEALQHNIGRLALAERKKGQK